MPTANNKRSAYRSPAGRKIVHDLYDEKLKSMGREYHEIKVNTQFGSTHVVRMGNPGHPAILVIHGAGTGSHVAMDAMATLADQFCLYGIDIPAHPNKSEETPVPFKQNGFGRWLVEVMDGLELEKASAIGISYGGWALQRLLMEDASRISAAILVVPAGIVTNNPLTVMRKVAWPYLRYRKSNVKKGSLLFMEAICTDWDEFYVRWNEALFEHFKFDSRIPPMIKARDVAEVQTPIYVLASEFDVFFPGKRLLIKAEKMYPNFRKGLLWKGAKHIPSLEDFPALAELARGYLNEELELAQS